MEDALAPFLWLDRSDDILSDIFCVSFFRGLTPTEVLRRFGRADATGEEMSFDELRDLAEEFVLAGQGVGGYVGVVQMNGWSVAVELEGGEAIVRHSTLSRDCEMLAVSRHDYAEDEIVYAAAGELITRIVPIPGVPQDYGDTKALDHLLHKVGMPTDSMSAAEWDALGDRLAEHRYPRAFALAAEVTGVPFTQDLLRLPLLVGRVAA